MFDTVHTPELPRALQHLLSRSGTPDDGATLPRRSFLKLAAGSGFALGAFPVGLSWERLDRALRQSDDKVL